MPIMWIPSSCQAVEHDPARLASDVPGGDRRNQPQRRSQSRTPKAEEDDCLRIRDGAEDPHEDKAWEEHSRGDGAEAEHSWDGLTAANAFRQVLSPPSTV